MSWKTVYKYINPIDNRYRPNQSIFFYNNNYNGEYRDLVFNIHGYTGSGTRQHNITFKDKNLSSMEKEKYKHFLFISPSAPFLRNGRPSWTEGLDSNQPKHVYGLIESLKYLEKEFLPISINYGFIPNKSKIFVTGYSQGGEMSAISSFIKIGDFNASHSIGLAEFINYIELNKQLTPDNFKNNYSLEIIESTQDVYFNKIVKWIEDTKNIKNYLVKHGNLMKLGKLDVNGNKIYYKNSVENIVLNTGVWGNHSSFRQIFYSDFDQFEYILDRFIEISNNTSNTNSHPPDINPSTNSNPFNTNPSNINPSTNSNPSNTNPSNINPSTNSNPSNTNPSLSPSPLNSNPHNINPSPSNINSTPSNSNPSNSNANTYKKNEENFV